MRRTFSGSGHCKKKTSSSRVRLSTCAVSSVKINEVGEINVVFGGRFCGGARSAAPSRVLTSSVFAVSRDEVFFEAECQCARFSHCPKGGKGSNTLEVIEKRNR